MKKIGRLFPVYILFLTACGAQTEAAPTPISAQATAINSSSTETPSPFPFTETPPAPTQDPTIFGAIGLNEIQAFALEPVASEIFTRVMNGFIADEDILEYQMLSVTIFPGGGGLLSEITFNVRTTDPAWLADGGTSAPDDWINDKCYRFDFVTTETEYQLKHRRLCN